MVVVEKTSLFTRPNHVRMVRFTKSKALGMSSAIVIDLGKIEVNSNSLESDHVVFCVSVFQRACHLPDVEDFVCFQRHFEYGMSFGTHCFRGFGGNNRCLDFFH